VKEVEGTLGDNLEHSSSVQCAVDYFGPADLRHRQGDREDTIVAKLLGGSAKEKPELAASASPVLYIDKNDPSFLIIHGTADPLVAYTQSVELHQVLQDAGVEVYFQTVTGAGHGNFGEAADDVQKRLSLFLENALYGAGKELPVNTLKFAGNSEPEVN